MIRLSREVPRGATLEVLESDLPPLGEGEFYVFQLEGLEVVDEHGKAIGRVRSVDPGVANDVLELDSGHLLPLVEGCVLRVDLEGGRIVVARGFTESE